MSTKTKSVRKAKVEIKPAVIPTASVTPNALSSKAILIKLYTSAFIGNPRDKKLTAQVEASNHTEAKRISVRKKICQGPELNKVSTALNRVRLLTERKTSPWLDGGIRIIPAKKYVETKLEIEAAIREFFVAVDEMVNALFSVIIPRDQVALNGTFDIADYPSADELRSKFAAKLEAMPIPTDFRVEGIDDSTREAMQTELEKLSAERVKDAKREIVSRMLEKVKHLGAKLSAMSDTERLNKKAIDNISEVCDDVLSVVFDDDAEIIGVAQSVKAALADLSADVIRISKPAHKEACEKVSAELAKVESLMAGFMS